MRARLLCVIGMSLWSAAAGARQVGPATMPRELREHVQDERFDIVSSSGGLPGGVRTELRTLFGGQTLDLAEPGARFQGSGRKADAKLPLRRLVAAGCSNRYCLVYYERGGSSHMWRAVLFHWTPYLTTLEWGGTAPGGMTTIEEVRRAVLSGTITGSAGPW